MLQLRKVLERIPTKMAEEVTPFIEKTSIDGYKNFLNSMYHYTMLSGERLKFAASKTNDLEAKELFIELAEEEDSHFKLALSDLKSMGLSADETPISLVDRFHNFWMTRKEFQEWLGILLALEGVSAYIGDIAKSNLIRLGIKPYQASFVLEHLEADEVHGEKTIALCEKYATSNTLIEAANYAATFWIELHKEALSL